MGCFSLTMPGFESSTHPDQSVASLWPRDLQNKDPYVVAGRIATLAAFGRLPIVPLFLHGEEYVFSPKPTG